MCPVLGLCVLYEPCVWAVCVVSGPCAGALCAVYGADSFTLRLVSNNAPAQTAPQLYICSVVYVRVCIGGTILCTVELAAPAVYTAKVVTRGWRVTGVLRWSLGGGGCGV